MSGKARLFAGTATAACAIALSAAPAGAQCVANASTVTCTGTVTASTVNTAIATVPGTAVTVRIQPDAVVTRDAAAIQPFNPPFTGAVDIGNAGTLGTAAATVGVNYFGAGLPLAGNTLALANSGTITGLVQASGVGGTITAINTGTLSGGINLSGVTDITLTSSGPIYVATGGAGTTAVSLNSFRQATATTGTVGVDALTTTTTTGGIATATITAPVAIPAAGTAVAVPQGINIVGVGGARLTLNALAGAVTVRSNGFNSTSIPGGGNTTTTAGTTTTTTGNTSTAVGGTATAALGADAQVASLAVTGGVGASATIAGQVGSADAAGNVNVTANAANTVFSSRSVSSATASSSESTSISTTVGGAASVDLAATGRVFGSVSAASNGGPATVAIAGIVGAGSGTAVTTPGNVTASSTGTIVTNTTSNTTGPVAGDFTNASQVTRSATGQAATITIASTGAIFGSASATGDGSASVDNAGRIRDNVNVTSSRTIQTSQPSASSRITTAGTAGASTLATTSSASSVNTTIGGTATFQNRAGGVVEDNVFVSGLGGASLTNAGGIFGNVSLTSAGTVSTSANSSTNTTTTTPATGGGTATRVEQVSSNSNTSTPNGGAVTGIYAGTVGAVGGSGLAGFRSVTQNGQGGSTATIAGTLYADVNSTAGGAATTSSSGSTSLQTTQAAVAPATPAQEFTSTSTSRNGTTQLVANNLVTVTGSVRNNNTGTGNIQLATSSGNSTLNVTGGIVDGGLTVGAGGINSTSGSDSAFRSTVLATTAGPGAAFVPQSSVNTFFNENRGAGGTAAVSLTGAQIGGGILVAGSGTGAGSAAAALTVSADSIVAGSVQVLANPQPNLRTDNSTTDTRTAVNATNRVARQTSVQTAPTQVGGNATLTLAGRAASATVGSSYGNASATLTGQLTGGIQVSTGTVLSSSTSEQRFAGTSTTAFDFPSTTQTASTQSGGSTNVGGTASLAINSSATLQAAGTSAVANSVNVSGIGGSTLTIGAGTRVIAGNAGSIFVGTGATDTSFASTGTFAAGTQTDLTSTSTSRRVGGAASVTNAGIVGSSTGFFGAPVFITVQSIGGAALANTGTIYGGISANAIGTDVNNTAVSTGLNDAVTTRTTTTNVNTARGGVATVTNSGVVSGRVTVAGATGTVTNTGVLRNGVSLGQAVAGFTTQQVTTATSTTTTATAPATRFAQTYTVDQNALLIGGINVAGATVADPTTGAVTGATIQTSTITAAVNLNGGSVTLGDIAGQVALDGTRLTATTVRMTGAGYLGVGTNDEPTGALGTGNGELRFVNTPAFAPFVAIDPALGTVNGTTFSPSVGLVSGSRITGALLVEKSGTGVFTIVGTPFIAGTPASPVARYTIDAGTVRVSGGELQLGVSGTDPVTGAGIFAIRGNVENTGGTLVLGRRVTDGSTTVLQGTAVRIDGNLTQAAGGTISLAATPALVRSNGIAVGPLPAEGILGFGGYGVALTPFVAFDPTTSDALRSTPSSLTVNGNVSLSGTVAVATSPGAIYTAGRNLDLLTVSGTFAQSSLTLAPGFTSPFVRFALTPRTSGTSTIVSLDVQRTPYASVATTTNAAASAAALDTALPGVVSAITAIRSPNAVVDVQGYGRLQDLATVIAGLDTQLTAAEAATAFTQLGSGSFYGSLAAVTTTAAFGDVTDYRPAAGEGIGLWVRPSGRFTKFDGDNATGASRLRADNYGGAIGFNVSTGSSGEFGVGAGYGRIDARDRDFPSTAHADTYMIGAYAAQRFDAFNVGVQGVFGWSNWDASRRMPLFARTAQASFDSKEFRFNARVGYDLALSGAQLTPFAQAEVRRYSFDAFEEEEAGGIGLAAARHQRTVFSPELGLRATGDFSGVRPFAEASYVFQGDVKGYRDVAYLGSTATTFRLQGVDPEGFAKLAGGVQADVYGARFFVRAAYLTGGGNETGEVMGGVSLRF